MLWVQIRALMALADAPSTVRTVMSRGDALLRVRSSEVANGDAAGMTELGSLSNPSTGTVWTREREREWKHASAGSGSKRLTSVLVCHADLQSERVWSCSFKFSTSNPSPAPPRPIQHHSPKSQHVCWEFHRCVKHTVIVQVVSYRQRWGKVLNKTRSSD